MQDIQEDKEAFYGRLRFLVESYYDIQDMRIITGNRLFAIAKVLNIPKEDIVETNAGTVYQGVEDIEDQIKKLLEQELKDNPVWQGYLRRIRGMGIILASGLLGYIEDISKFENVAKLWAYFGQRVVDGHAEKRHRGEKIHYNPKAKVLAWKIGESFVKAGKGYRALYNDFKKREQEVHAERCPNCKSPKGHIHARAKRKTVKLLLSHLWHVWRSMEGLSTQGPYAMDILKHSGYIPPIYDRD